MCFLCYCVYRFDGDFVIVVKFFVNSGFKSVYVIKGGVEGLNGWNVRIVKLFFFFVFFLEINLEVNVFI